ncbi:hypothetical protein A9P82_01160 [Arachidicoccus ginsenosidimutans]|uniref:hypothetical protein n=1 Tax=Arachidicoccus sp. BS20 TaxID=1850526 RepID=UPI0007F06590|nr:hypothetical protein [Arachidicoccus sp. BS20]ANI88049.1 hypothetical protein A9P82_01160 [Arachidicoccus sp. BS20]
MANRFFKLALCFLTFLLLTNFSYAQSDDATQFSIHLKKDKKKRNPGSKGTIYGSWGYNKEWYTPSNIHIDQPSLGNNYTLRNVYAGDKPGWNKGLFNKALSIPQYNYRLGYFFKDNWAVEINFDHTKYVVANDQLLHAVGTMNGQKVDTFIDNRKGFIRWQLNNGANFLLFNLVRRTHITDFNTDWFDASAFFKGGIGVVIPHVQNTIDGHSNHADFQFGGFNQGVEATVRATFFNHVYLEYCNKLDLAEYSHLHIYEGEARQLFGTYEMILNIGVSVPLK